MDAGSPARLDEETIVASDWLFRLGEGLIGRIYDPDTNTWRAAATMATPRAGHAAVHLGSGRVSHGQALVFEDASNGWIPLEDIPGGMGGMLSWEGRYGGGAVLLPDGRVVVIGGIAFGGIAAREPLMSDRPFPP